MTRREEVIEWLRSAYAMEMVLSEVLANHARDAMQFPEVHQGTG